MEEVTQGSLLTGKLELDQESLGKVGKFHDCNLEIT